MELEQYIGARKPVIMRRHFSRKYVSKRRNENDIVFAIFTDNLENANKETYGMLK